MSCGGDEYGIISKIIYIIPLLFESREFILTKNFSVIGILSLIFAMFTKVSTVLLVIGAGIAGVVFSRIGWLKKNA